MNGRKTALVCGMAKSGVASARLLWEQGYQVTINDMKKEIPGLKEQLAGIEYTDALGQDPMELVAGQDLVVLSPVIPIFAPFAKKAKALNLDAIHDTVHEMARDEARHGKAFEGLLKRYFG